MNWFFLNLKSEFNWHFVFLIIKSNNPISMVIIIMLIEIVFLKDGNQGQWE